MNIWYFISGSCYFRLWMIMMNKWFCLDYSKEDVINESVVLENWMELSPEAVAELVQLLG